MKQGPLAALAFLLVACSPGPSPESPVTTPAPTSPTPAEISPIPTAGMPVTAVDFSCRLPAVTREGGGDDFTMQGGFLTFPAAQFTPDPRGRFNSRYFEGGLAGTASPVLYGIGGSPFYDRAQSRWVPVSAQQARADGGAYAYATVDSPATIVTVHVVTVATGADRTFRLALPRRLEVADYGVAGIYLTEPSALGGPGEGVWLLDPATGVVKKTWTIHRVWTVRDGYAWVARLDPRDKTQWQPSELPPADSVVRIDLRSGAEEVWFYRAGSYPWLTGFASGGRPVVTVTHPDDTYDVFLTTPNNQSGTLVYSGGLQFTSVQGDGERLWLGREDGIYLYRPAAGLQKVFAYVVNPDFAPSIEPAGFCL